MKKKILALLLGAFMIATMLVGCGGAGSQDTFLSKLLADETIDLTDTGRREIKDFCNSQDVPIKEDEIAAFEITDLFLDYDAVYKLSFRGNSNYNPEQNEWENLMINSITIDVKFETEKDVDSGISKIRQHLTSKIGATQSSSGEYDSYKLFINENDETCVYAKITCSVEKEKTAVIKINFECFPTEDAEIIKAFIQEVPDTYFNAGFKCVMVKPSGNDGIFLFFDNVHPMNIYRYEDGKVEKIENETISAFGTMKLLEDNQIALSGFGDDAGKYALYSYENGKLTLVKNIDEKTYKSYIGIERADTIISEYTLSYDSIIDAYNNIIDWEKEIELLKEEEKELAYVEYMKETFNVEAEGARYNLLDLDNDGIKELVYSCSTTAAGMGILSYYNGFVVDNHLESGVLCYLEGQNKIYHRYGRMGYYGDRVGHLENGNFVVDIEGSYSESVDENGELVYEYDIDGETVSYEEYNERFGDISKVYTSFEDWMSFNELVNYISNN